MERFSDNLITITSCTNHSGAHENDAAILVLQKKLIISPKIIKPNPTMGCWMNINMNSIPTSVNGSVRRETTPPRKK
jgi:hypothetical protein